MALPPAKQDYSPDPVPDRYSGVRGVGSNSNRISLPEIHTEKCWRIFHKRINPGEVYPVLDKRRGEVLFTY